MNIEEVLMENGATEISVENGGYYSWDGCLDLNPISQPKYNVSFELDRSGLENIAHALDLYKENEGGTLSEMDEIKRELIKIHAVRECDGNGMCEKIDNYLCSNEDFENDYTTIAIERYHIKHR